MARNRTTSASVTTDRQTDADHERPRPVTRRGRGKNTVGRANKTSTKEAPAQDLVAANTRSDADAEIAELKGDSHEHTSVNHSYDLLTFFAAQLVEAQRLQKEAEGQIAKIVPQVTKEDDRQDIVTIPKPKGEAGDKKNGFNLRAAMQLDDTAQKDLYDAIQVCDLESPVCGDIAPSHYLVHIHNKY